MRKSKLSLILLSAIIASSALFGACKPNKPADNPDAGKPAVKADPFGKYDPAITQTSIRIKTSWMVLDEGDDEDNNVWSRAVKEHLGIELKQLWTAPDWGSPFDEKVNIAITTDNLPDNIPVYTTLFFRLVENKRAADLTKIFDEYASDKVKAMAQLNGGVSLKSSTFDGKLYGIGSPPSNDGRTFLWLRKDWMDKLDLQAPKNLDDLFAIAKAFATKDPNGNGKQDEIGLPLTKNFFGGPADVRNIFNAYHLYPRTWMEKDGKLMRTDTDPAMKTVLNKLAELYKDGVISKEFTIKDPNKDLEADYVAGRVGIAFGGANHVASPSLKGAFEKDGAIWEAYDMPTVDGKTINAQFESRVGNFLAASHKNKNPEAVIKMLNFQFEVDAFNPKYVKDNTFNMSPKNNMNFWCKPSFGIDEPNKGAVDAKAVFEALNKKDPSGLKMSQKETYDKIMKFNEDPAKANPDLWSNGQMYKAGGSVEMWLSDKYKDAKWISPAWGPETDAWVQNGQDLHTKVQEHWIKAITTGKVDEEFDNFLNYWKTQGGAEATTQINEWYSKNK
jgi:putative aldouronate transport system substrate-binding protein